MAERLIRHRQVLEMEATHARQAPSRASHADLLRAAAAEQFWRSAPV
jgi:hypothetical protein